MAKTQWHTLSSDEIKKCLMTSDQGLNNSDIKSRISKYGPNEIAEGEKNSLMEMLISQFKDIMVIILLFAVAISVVVANRRDESPIEAIVSATSMGPKTLGPRAPKSGILREGYDADILTLEANPLEDITIFQEFNNITGVFKGGKLEINRGIHR